MWLIIGKDTNSSRLYSKQPPATSTAGTLDHTRIYNRALSAAEIMQLFKSTGG